MGVVKVAPVGVGEVRVGLVRVLVMGVLGVVLVGVGVIRVALVVVGIASVAKKFVMVCRLRVTILEVVGVVVRLGLDGVLVVVGVISIIL